MPKKKLAKPFELPRTFFSQNLLEVDPFELRHKLFIEHHERELPGLFEDLLDALEDQAGEALKQNPPPALFKEEYTTARTWLYEKEFYGEFAGSGLTHQQANAIAALYSVRSIRREYFAFEHIRDDPEVARILVEMFLLTMAAMRGGFRILLEKSESQRVRLKKNQPKAVDAKQQKASTRQYIICQLFKDLGPRRSKRKTALCIGDFIHLALAKPESEQARSRIGAAIRKTFEKQPSLRNIEDSIADLFHAKLETTSTIR